MNRFSVMLLCVILQELVCRFDEYKELHGTEVDIQSEVEATELYIISRCVSNDNEQLGLVDTRLECLEDFKTDLNLGTEVDQIYDGIS